MMVQRCQRVRQDLECREGEARQSSRDGDNSDTVGKAHDKGSSREEHHAGQVHSSCPKLLHHPIHDCRKENGGDALQKESQTSHPDTCRETEGQTLLQWPTMGLRQLSTFQPQSAPAGSDSVAPGLLGLTAGAMGGGNPNGVLL